jgi:hypothetical protein
VPAGYVEHHAELFATQRPAFALEAPRVTVDPTRTPPQPPDVHRFPHEGYWPEPAPGADPYQALDASDATLPPDGLADATTTDTPSVAPVPAPGTSPLVRRRGAGGRGSTPPA